MVPGALGGAGRSGWASPERGCTKPASPSGIATATPVPTSARCSGASSTSSATARSAPASPGRAYRGAVASGELRRTGTSTSGREGSGTQPTLAAPLPAVAEVVQHPAGQVLGGPAVAPTGHGGA